MKTLYALTLTLAATVLAAQNASFTVKHAPLSPNDTAWVAVGDTIEFIYGGGGPHPMTSGHGTFAPSPVFFPTVTVTSANPRANCVLDSVGVYLFHCGTNPGNTNNWGTIVVGQIGLDEQRIPLQAWLVGRELHLNGTPPNTLIRVVDDAGRCVLRTRWTEEPIALTILNPGTYTVVTGTDFRASRFILD